MASKQAICSRLGKRVKEMRLSLHLSQEELASLCKVDRAYIGAIERGECNPTIWIVARIAAGLDISISKLLERV